MAYSKRVSLLALSAAIFLSACSGPSPTVISGTLLGHDGEPMVAAGVRVSSWSISYQPDSINTGAVFRTVEDGRFEIQTFETGLLSVQFAGAYHEDHVLPIYADTAMAIVVDVRLGTAEHPEEFETVEAQVRLDDSDDEEEVELTKQPDGLYTAEIETTDSLVTYSLFARGDDEYYSGHGTDSDEFVFTRGYESVIRPTDGVAEIVFDPSKLSREENTAVTTFADANSFPARFAKVRDRAEERTEAFYDAWRESDDEDFEYDWSADIAELEAAIDSEQDLVLGQTLLFELLTVKSDGGEIAPDWLSRGLEECPDIFTLVV